MISESDRNESDQSVVEEIEALKAILFTELDIVYSPSGRPLELKTIIFPSTADDANQQYVCLTLVMKFPPSYPDHPPLIDLRNPRGLGEDFIANALKLCHEKTTQFSGSPVVYEIIELLRECLTNSNRPTGHCTICLFDFHPDDIFTYTPCYHHFHSHCLSRFCESLKDQWKAEDDQDAINNPSGANWKEKKSKQFTCPVCREVIDVDIELLKLAPPPHEVENFHEEFLPDAKFNAWRKQMEEQYLRQKVKGGIIDREMEDNRFLVVTETATTTVSTNPPETPTEEEPQADQPVHPVQATVASKVSTTGKTEWTRSQRPARGRWNRRADMNFKERPPSGHNAPRPSNPSNRVCPQEKHSGQPRKHGKESVQPNNEVHPNGAVQLPTPLRPPPGFEPR